MNTSESGPALLVVDMQTGFHHPSWGRRNNPRMEDRIAELLWVWRANNGRVMHAKHMSTLAASPLRPDQPGNDFMAFATPLPEEYVLEKRVNSCFIGTSFETDLRRFGHDTLVIVGLTTNHCISTTARMAGNLGFKTWVISDATATFDRIGPDGTVHTAEQIQAIALSDLHGEFATVVNTKTLIGALRASASARWLRLE